MLGTSVPPKGLSKNLILVKIIILLVTLTLFIISVGFCVCGGGGGGKFLGAEVCNSNLSMVAIGRFSEAGLHEWLPFVIVHARGCSNISGQISE